MMKIKPYLHTSSHGLKHRHLPYALKNASRGNDRKFFPIIIDAKGNRKLDNEIISKIVQCANSNAGDPQVHVVLLGK